MRIVFTASGEVAMFNAAKRVRIAATIAEAAAVDPSRVFITVTAASVHVTAEVSTSSQSQSTQLATKLRNEALGPLLLASAGVTVIEVPLIEIINGPAGLETLTTNNVSQSLNTGGRPSGPHIGGGRLGSAAIATIAVVLLVAIAAILLLCRLRKSRSTLKRLDEVWLEPDPTIKGGPQLLLHGEVCVSEDMIEQSKVATIAMLAGRSKSEEFTITMPEEGSPTAEGAPSACVSARANAMQSSRGGANASGQRGSHATDADHLRTNRI